MTSYTFKKEGEFLLIKFVKINQYFISLFYQAMKNELETLKKRNKISKYPSIYFIFRYIEENKIKFKKLSFKEMNSLKNNEYGKEKNELFSLPIEAVEVQFIIGEKKINRMIARSVPLPVDITKEVLKVTNGSDCIITNTGERIPIRYILTEEKVSELSEREIFAISLRFLSNYKEINVASCLNIGIATYKKIIGCAIIKLNR